MTFKLCILLCLGLCTACATSPIYTECTIDGVFYRGVVLEQLDTEILVYLSSAHKTIKNAIIPRTACNLSRDTIRILQE